MHAASYGNEALVGEGLQEEMQQGKRQRLFITSKVWNDAHKPDAVRCGAATSVVFTGYSGLPGATGSCSGLRSV